MIAALSRCARHEWEERDASVPCEGGSGAIHDARIMDSEKANVLFCAVPDLIRDLLDLVTRMHLQGRGV